MENTTIKLTVGVLDTSVLVPNLIDLNLSEAISILNKSNIKYKLVYSASDKDNDVVINQSIKKGKKIKLTDILIITVSKNDDDKTDSKTDDSNENNETSNDVSSWYVFIKSLVIIIKML